MKSQLRSRAYFILMALITSCSGATGVGNGYGDPPFSSPFNIDIVHQIIGCDLSLKDQANADIRLYPFCEPLDLNQDRKVDAADLDQYLFVSDSWTRPSNNDLNGDGFVDVSDFLIVQVCQPTYVNLYRDPAPQFEAFCSTYADLNGDGQVTSIDLVVLATNFQARERTQKIDGNGDGRLDASDYSYARFCRGTYRLNFCQNADYDNDRDVDDTDVSVFVKYFFNTPAPPLLDP